MQVGVLSLTSVTATVMSSVTAVVPSVACGKDIARTFLLIGFVH